MLPLLFELAPLFLRVAEVQGGFDTILDLELGLGLETSPSAWAMLLLLFELAPLFLRVAEVEGGFDNVPDLVFGVLAGEPFGMTML